MTVFFEVKIQVPPDLPAEECTVDDVIQRAFKELEEMLGDQNIMTHADNTRQLKCSTKMTVTDQSHLFFFGRQHLCVGRGLPELRRGEGLLNIFFLKFALTLQKLYTLLI